jgi:hypothetical protein
MEEQILNTPIASRYKSSIDFVWDRRYIEFKENIKFYSNDEFYDYIIQKTKEIIESKVSQGKVAPLINIKVLD